MILRGASSKPKGRTRTATLLLLSLTAAACFCSFALVGRSRAWSAVAPPDSAHSPGAALEPRQELVLEPPRAGASSSPQPRPPVLASSVILCESTKGPFRIRLAPASESPKSTRFLTHLVQSGFWEVGGGVAFFRVNEWITQFGAKGREYKLPRVAGMSTDDHTRDANPEPDSAKRPPFKRGDMSLLGGTQFMIVRKPNRHMGVFDRDTVVGRISEPDMQNVIDRLFAYNDIIDHPKRGPGPDQTEIYRRGWAYLDALFPKVDRITSCRFE
jgi:hypothetical protein